MSRSATTEGVATHLAHAAVLAGYGALVFYVTRAVPGTQSSLWSIAALGFLLLAGTLTSELTSPLGLPHLTGYLAAGVAAGPHVLRLVDTSTLKSLSPVNTLALSLIALAGGAELELSALRRGARGLLWSLLVQTSLVFVVMLGVFYAAHSFLPFPRALAPPAAFGAALMWASISVTRSPSATLGILSQTRASGPLATYTLAFVMASDVVVVILLAAAISIARPLIEPGEAFSFDAFAKLGHELFGSVAIGTTLGLAIAAYLRLVNRQMLVVLLVLGFGVSTVLEYLQFDSLLAFMVAGIVVRNLSRQGHKFIEVIEQTGTVVYVVFFALAGAELDVPLLRTLWPIALLFAASRAVTTWVAAGVSSRIARDGPILRRWAASGLISQAGLTLGLSIVVSRTFPSIGGPFRALAIATVAVNEVIGPIVFKFALDRSGETSRQPAVSFPSMRPPPFPSPPSSP